LPASTAGTTALDLGFFNGGAQVSLQISNTVDLGNTWATRADGSLATLVTDSRYLYVNAAATNYPTASGGDGRNHFPGGGANYDIESHSYGLAGASTTDTTNPSAIRFGAVVGTFSASPQRSDWFLIGVSNTVTVPTGGAHLYLAVSDAFYSNNIGNYLGSFSIQSSTQTQAAVTLAITNLPAGVQLSWPDWANSFVLEKATNALQPPPWTSVTNTPVQASGTFSMTLDARVGTSFFRLRRTSP
jgi:hypothetical protein